MRSREISAKSSGSGTDGTKLIPKSCKSLRAISKRFARYEKFHGHAFAGGGRRFPLGAHPTFRHAFFPRRRLPALFDVAVRSARRESVLRESCRSWAAGRSAK